MKGEVTITFRLDAGGLLVSQDVLYIPGLKKNFLSISGMEDRVFVVTFQIGKVLISIESYLGQNDGHFR